MRKMLMLMIVATLTAMVSAAGAVDIAPQMLAGRIPTANNWTGVYLGAVGGWTKTRAATSVAGVSLADLDADGVSVGGQLGYDRQFGSLVVGVVGDWSWVGAKAGTNVAGLIDAESRLDQVATLRAKLGVVPFDDVLVYATGGGAYGHVKASASAPALGLNGDANAQHWGWTAGAGVAFALDRHWTAQVEYLRVDLGSMDLTMLGVPTSSRVTADVLRGGFLYRF